MNYDQPRQILLPDGTTDGWHFTRRNRRSGIHPLGYCAQHGGHSTEDEARACYTDYLLTEALRLDGNTSDAWYHCEASGCDTLTNQAATVGEWHLYVLCDEHRDREHVAVLFGIAANSIHS